MRYLRKITNKTRKDRERNTNIREQLNIKPITQIIENKQLKWYGHIKRMEKQRIPRKVMETRMEEKRTRGRPRVTWMETIEKAGKRRGKTIKELNKLTTNRKEWRKFAENPPTPLA